MACDLEIESWSDSNDSIFELLKSRNMFMYKELKDLGVCKCRGEMKIEL